MSAAVKKCGHLVSKRAHTPASEAHVEFYFVFKLYFQKNLCLVAWNQQLGPK